VAQPEHVLALDVGGTEIKYARIVIGPDGTVTTLDRGRAPTPLAPEDGTATARAVVTTAAGLAAADTPAGRPAALGVVVPGVVENGVGVYSANLGWRDFPFAAELAAATGLPVAFGQDVLAAGLAEYRLGAARGVTDAAIMPIGTGIAATLVLDGCVRVSEIGHVDVGNGVPCGCGQTGCVEAVGSAGAIARRYTAATGRPVTGAEDVLAAATGGDPVAGEVWSAALDALARGILVLATVVGPEVVVLGGGLAGAGTALTEPLAARLAGLITFQRTPELRLAALGDEAGCLGAGLLAQAHREQGNAWRS
jgi:glucokinase